MNSPIEISLHSKIGRRRGLSTQEVDDTLVVTDESASWCYGMEHIAGRIWQFLDQPQTVDELCASLRDLYDIDQATCERDVLEFVEELNREGLIEVV